MTAIRTALALATLATGVAIALLRYGWLRAPVALLCGICLALLFVVEAIGTARLREPDA